MRSIVFLMFPNSQEIWILTKFIFSFQNLGKNIDNIFFDIIDFSPISMIFFLTWLADWMVNELELVNWVKTGKHEGEGWIVAGFKSSKLIIRWYYIWGL